MGLFEGIPEASPKKPRTTHAPKPSALERAREKISKPLRVRNSKEKPRAHFYESHCEPASGEETIFRHGHWKERRVRVREALVSTRSNEHQLWAFDHCGSACQVEYSPSTKRTRLRANYCHNRHCEPCMRAKANKMGGNLRRKLATRPNGRYRFVTLSIKHSRTPLCDQIDKLYADFKKLRNGKWWKSIVRGGMATLEVKLDENDDFWHPHLHLIVEGDFIPQSQLSEHWLAATGDSSIVHVRALENAQGAAFYLTKYVTKSTSGNVWHLPDRAQEWVVASKGVRAAFTFGNWRGFKLLETRKDITDWKRVCTLNKLICDLRECEPYAIGLWRELRPPAKTPEEEPLDDS
jgi:hypothetical protein